jgi:hypothetical protein
MVSDESSGQVVKEIELTEQPPGSGEYTGELSLPYGRYRMHAEIRVDNVRGGQTPELLWEVPTPTP